MIRPTARRWRQTTAAVLTALAVLFGPGLGVADEPPRKPAAKSVCSPNGLTCAIMDPETNQTIVSRGRAVLWSMAGWYRVASLADDGEHLVLGHDGMNLLPLNSGMDTVILTFVRRGDVIRRVRLAEVVESRASLRRTLSHLTWGSYLGFDQAGRYLIQTVEVRRIAFDVTSGRPVEAP